MGVFKKFGKFIKKNSKKIGAGILKAGSLAVNLAPIPGAGFISQGLSSASNLVKNSAPTGGMQNNSSPGLGGLSVQGSGSLGGMDIQIKGGTEPEPEPQKETESSSKTADIVKWAGIGLAAKMLLGL